MKVLHVVTNNKKLTSTYHRQKNSFSSNSMNDADTVDIKEVLVSSAELVSVSGNVQVVVNDTVGEKESICAISERENSKAGEKTNSVNRHFLICSLET